MSVPVFMQKFKIYKLYINIKLKSEHFLGKTSIQNGRDHYKVKKLQVVVLTNGIILCLEN